MDSKQVRQYITQDLSFEEKQSYIKYINGDKTETIWIEKANIRREPILQQELKCNKCNSWVNVSENGLCNCINNHKCYDVVFPILSFEEKQSYIKYINGDNTETIWVEKANIQEEMILQKELKCNNVS